VQNLNWIIEDLYLQGDLGSFKKFPDLVKRAESLISKLRSFTSEPPVCISSGDTHHTMIVTLLILNRTSLLYASPSRPTCEDALDQACSQYISSDTHNAVKEQFSLPPKQYSTSQFTEFVLSRRF